MPKSKKGRYVHPYLFTDGRKILSKKNCPVVGLEPVRSTRHHLYPKDRGDIPAVNKEKFLLRLWGYKHFQGWNPLFQFCFVEDGAKHCSELTIDEIITLMAIKHPFIVNKVGSKPWKILFGEKELEDALDLLCRMLAWKFNYKWQKCFPKKITLVAATLAA
ncbi:MAG TPA: hypothetical protein VG694_02570 [Candidatus Paceibacterota bacterium]|nr:hypothetical protein [Candidatus Paceibacterota bacterium]